MSFPLCPNCQSEFVYPDQHNLICPECAYEWNPAEALADAEMLAVKDSNGTRLQVGDKVIFIKDLKIKGSAKVLKIGAKGLIRRITEGKDHQLDCKVDGIGEMMVTAKYVKRA
jgi:protein PhnA